MTNTLLYKPVVYLLVLCLLLVSCNTVKLAGYDQKAYENATTLKPETLAPVSKSSTSDGYANNQDQVEKLFIRLESAFEYANGIDYNNEAVNNWRNMISETLEDWHEEWKNNQSLTPVGASEIRNQIGLEFDTIIS